MQRRFKKLVHKVEPLLARPYADPTEPGISAIDTSVNECNSYLNLIEFPQEDMINVSDLQSLFNLLMPYLNFQRFHILEMIVDQFKSAKAGTKMSKYRNLLNKYRSQVNLGQFVLATAMQTPLASPPFMRPFSLQLESKWATCTIQDLEILLARILPNSIAFTFVWFCNAIQVPKYNSISLEYVVSPSVVEILREEAEKKQGILRCAGILRICVDGASIPEVRMLLEYVKLYMFKFS